MTRWVFSIVLAIVLTGCSQADSRDQVMQDQIQKVRDVTAVLKTVVDTPTAQAAAPKLKAINDSIPAILERDKQLGALTPDERQKLVKKYLPQQQEAFAALQAEIKRLSDLDPAVREQIAPNLQNLLVPTDAPQLPPVPAP